MLTPARRRVPSPLRFPGDRSLGRLDREKASRSRRNYLALIHNSIELLKMSSVHQTRQDHRYADTARLIGLFDVARRACSDYYAGCTYANYINVT